MMTALEEVSTFPTIKWLTLIYVLHLSDNQVWVVEGSKDSTVQSSHINWLMDTSRWTPKNLYCILFWDFTYGGSEIPVIWNDKMGLKHHQWQKSWLQNDAKGKPVSCMWAVTNMRGRILVFWVNCLLWPALGPKSCVWVGWSLF